ncbi:type II CAAX prenyl endopeptidase Rce1 family protein [Lactococcus lactis]|uniref:CPBP family glutamic-type intramembrane protease n=1 Tax=Lactococcus lactis TaxID=1358 RepID=UPI000C9F399C|nr:CPBP family glutamic-type intramembrane protease [Lactococcus lactis]AUS68873.1 CAAX protease family protein [Lactococcus lactis subsp. lactis]
MEVSSILKQLFTARMSKSAVPFSLIILALGFSALIYQVPFIAPFSLAIAGFVSLYILFGIQGISYTFSKPKKLVSTFFIGLIAAFVFAFSGLIFATKVLNSNTHDNPIAAKMNWIELLKTIPMLLGEELITIVLLLIIVNILGGTRKALVIGVTVSTIIFGLLHLSTYDWNFAQVLLVIAFARIPFTLATLRSDSIYSGYFIHLAYDWIAFLSYMLTHH